MSKSFCKYYSSDSRPASQSRVSVSCSTSSGGVIYTCSIKRGLYIIQKPIRSLEKCVWIKLFFTEEAENDYRANSSTCGGKQLW